MIRKNQNCLKMTFLKFLFSSKRSFSFLLYCKCNFAFSGDVEPLIENATVNETSENVFAFTWQTDTPGSDTKLSLVPNDVTARDHSYSRLFTDELKITDGLLFGTKYLARITAVRDGVYGKSVFLSFTTRPGGLGLPRATPEVTSLSGPISFNGNFENISVQITPGGEIHWIYPGDILSWTFSGLNPGTAYMIAATINVDIYSRQTTEQFATKCAEVEIVTQTINGDDSTTIVFSVPGSGNTIWYRVLDHSNTQAETGNWAFKNDFDVTFPDSQLTFLLEVQVQGAVNGEVTLTGIGGGTLINVGMSQAQSGDPIVITYEVIPPVDGFVFDPISPGNFDHLSPTGIPITPDNTYELIGAADGSTISMTIKTFVGMELSDRPITKQFVTLPRARFEEVEELIEFEVTKSKSKFVVTLPFYGNLEKFHIKFEQGSGMDLQQSKCN